MDPLFWELHSGLPREAPGSREATLRALALTGLEGRPGGRLEVLDIGCGPGAATAVLLEALPEARVAAADLHRPFLDAAAARAGRARDRLTLVEADMGALPFPPGRFDLVWCEGAAYILGVEQALRLWRPLVAPGGRIAFSDAVWLVANPPEAARELWAEYPGMADLAGIRARIAAAGWRGIGDFVLPDAAWEEYYRPLAARCDALAAEHGAEHPVLAETRREIAVRRAHGASYGYAFFVAEPA